MSKKPKEPLSTRIDADVVTAIREIADQTDESLAGVVEAALRDFVRTIDATNEGRIKLSVKV